MKPNVIYTLKVIIIAALATTPLTLLIGMGYIKFLMVVQPNFSFNFNIQFVDIATFMIITALALLLGLQKNEAMGKVYSKSWRPFGYLLYSIIVFTLYLWAMGKLQGITIQNFLFSYGPMFFITLLCMRIFPLGKNVQKESIV